jgi:hypothetical protein
MKIEELYNASAFDVINKAIADKDEKIILGISTGLIVAMGDGIKANEQYCKDNNIPILPFPNSGGCIVIYPDDLVFGLLTKNVTTDFVPRFLQNFAKWLCNQGLNAAFTGNDILIDGQYKVASGSLTAFGNDFAYAPVHISMQVNLEQIRGICNKPMVKIPRGLEDYGFTPYEIRDVVKILIGGIV